MISWNQTASQCPAIHKAVTVEDYCFRRRLEPPVRDHYSGNSQNPATCYSDLILSLVKTLASNHSINWLAPILHLRRIWLGDCPWHWRHTKRCPMEGQRETVFQRFEAPSLLLECAIPFVNPTLQLSFISFRLSLMSLPTKKVPSAIAFKLSDFWRYVCFKIFKAWGCAGSSLGSLSNLHAMNSGQIWILQPSISSPTCSWQLISTQSRTHTNASSFGSAFSGRKEPLHFLMKLETPNFSTTWYNNIHPTISRRWLVPALLDWLGWWKLIDDCTMTAQCFCSHDDNYLMGVRVQRRSSIFCSTGTVVK